MTVHRGEIVGGGNTYLTLPLTYLSTVGRSGNYGAFGRSVDRYTNNAPLALWLTSWSTGNIWVSARTQTRIDRISELLSLRFCLGYAVRQALPKKPCVDLRRNIQVDGRLSRRRCLAYVSFVPEAVCCSVQNHLLSFSKFITSILACQLSHIRTSEAP